MATYEPPGEPQQPQGAPGYLPPQDPWAGRAGQPAGEGAPQYDPYATYPDPWAASTVDQPHRPGQPGHPDWPPPQRRGLLVPILIGALMVLLLGGAGGVAAWYVATHNTNPTDQPSLSASGPGAPTSTTSTHTSSTATRPASPTTTSAGSAKFDPHAVTEGQCLHNAGTDNEPKMQVVPCDDPSAQYKVIKRFDGADIAKNADGRFDNSTAETTCHGTGYQFWYGYRVDSDHTQDVMFCMVSP